MDKIKSFFKKYPDIILLVLFVIIGIVISVVSAGLLKVSVLTMLAFMVLAALMGVLLHPTALAFNVAGIVLIFLAGLVFGHIIIGIIVAAEFALSVGYFHLLGRLMK